MLEKVEIFFSYSHEDEDLCEQLMAHLSFLKWEGLTIDWYDRKIGAGEEWVGKINEHLHGAHIILLLVSSDFIRSDYCFDIEMRRAMARHEAGEVRVIPILLRPVYWESTPFGKLQALPKNGKSVTSWSNRDEAFLDIARSIRRVVEERLQQSTNNSQVSVESKSSIDLTEMPQNNLPLADSKPEPFATGTVWFRSSTEPQNWTPSLTVLLGGTAALVGLELMEHMLTLKQADRNHTSFIYIDADDPPDELGRFRSQHKDLFQETSLRIDVPPGIANASSFPQDGSLREPHTFIPNWIPQYFEHGTGGIRNNGHVAACFNYQSIYNTLETAIRRFIRLGIEQNTSRAHEVQANLVAFLGGGTGSGILPDIAVMIRSLLEAYEVKRRMNLFCILPEPIAGTSFADLEWRKSNTTACLLELIALSQAAGSNQFYRKYMRNRVYYLTNDPIANEVYLIGHTAMDNVRDITRIVSTDLFQRMTDASGVGSLEHSKWVDRPMLGGTDDRDLPTMFGITCPLEICFPAEETARAFAQLSANELSCMLTHYLFSPRKVNEAEENEWHEKWHEAAQLNSSADEKAIFNQPPSDILLDDIKNADQAQFDALWGRLEKYEQSVEKQIRRSIKKIRSQEIRRIVETSPQERSSLSLFYRQIQILKRMDQEYKVALSDLRENAISGVLERPVYLEKLLTGQCSLSPLVQDVVLSEIQDQYNKRLHIQVGVIRRNLLEEVLIELRRLVQDSLSHAVYLFEGINTTEHSQDLKKKCMAWQGLLDHPHPHQRHIFDLPQLRSRDGQNLAMERLYLWATTGMRGVDNEIHIDYSKFLDAIIEYLSTNENSPHVNHIDFTSRIVHFFQNFYRERFQNINLFNLLDIAVPPDLEEQSRNQQMSEYLCDHLERIRGLSSRHIAFHAELWEKGLSILNTSLYLGIQWRNNSQYEILRRALDKFVSERSGSRAFSPIIDPSIDSHRLQISYGQHAISLSTVSEFCRDHNSAMEAYLWQQKVWTNRGGENIKPVHSSEEMQRLVWGTSPSGPMHETNMTKVSLPERVIRFPLDPDSSPISPPNEPASSSFDDMTYDEL